MLVPGPEHFVFFCPNNDRPLNFINFDLHFKNY